MMQFDGVRIAGPQDEAALLSVLTLLHQENGLSPMSTEKVIRMIKHATGQQGGIIGVIDGEHGIEATIGMTISQWWYTDEYHLEEIWNFVHPDYRRTTHAKRLLEFAKWTSERLNLRLLCGVLSVKRLEGKMRLLQRQLPQIGALFMSGNLPTDRYDQKRVQTCVRAAEAPKVQQPQRK